MVASDMSYTVSATANPIGVKVGSVRIISNTLLRILLRTTADLLTLRLTTTASL